MAALLEGKLAVSVAVRSALAWAKAKKFVALIRKMSEVNQSGARRLHVGHAGARRRDGTAHPSVGRATGAEKSFRGGNAAMRAA